MRDHASLFAAALLGTAGLATPAAAYELPVEPPAEAPDDTAAPAAPRYMFGFALDGVRGVELGVLALSPRGDGGDRDANSDGEASYAVRARFDQLQTIVGAADGSLGWTLGLSGLLGADLEQRLWLDARVETGASIGLGFATLFPVVGAGLEKLGPVAAAHPDGTPLAGYGLVGLKARTGLAPGFGMDLVALYHIRGDALSHLHLGARALIGRGSPFLLGVAWDRFTETSGLSGTFGLAW